MATRFSSPIQTSSGSPTASYKTGTGSFPEVKWPGRGVDYPPPSSAEVKERVELYLYSTSGLVSCYRVNFTFLTLPLLHESFYDTKTQSLHRTILILLVGIA